MVTRQRTFPALLSPGTVHLVGDANEVDYIEGAMHSAWKVATAI
ncbi:hypothetical protein [Actinomadura bangladeshensis]